MPTGHFADKSVGTGKAVTASGYSLSGTDAGNYRLVQPTGLSANITSADVGVSFTATSTVSDFITYAASLGDNIFFSHDRREIRVDNEFSNYPTLNCFCARKDYTRRLSDPASVIRSFSILATSMSQAEPTIRFGDLSLPPVLLAVLDDVGYEKPLLLFKRSPFLNC